MSWFQTARCGLTLLFNGSRLLAASCRSCGALPSGIGFIAVMIGACALPLPSGCGKANWLKNGLIDPTQVGNFEKPVSNEIRESISILEEPSGIQNAEEPNADDLAPSLADQRIEPGDTLNVSMFEVLMVGAATNVQVRVGNSGFETFPVVGQVRVVGLTARELELELKGKLREMGIMQDADVQVSIAVSQAAQFSIVGNVARPNIYALPRPGYRLLEAIAAAGGIPPQVEKIYVFRNRTGEQPPADPPPLALWPAKPRQAAQAAPRLASSHGRGPRSAIRAGGAKAAWAVVPYTMSDASPSRAGPAQAEPPPQTEPTASEPAIDELEILEGRPTGEVPAPWWDAERGEWVVPSTQPLETATTEGPATQQSSQPLAAFARTGATSAAASEAAPEEQPLEEAAKQLALPLRIIEIPVKELLDGDPRYNICIRPFDTINIPEGMYGEYYLGGNVSRPGAYTLTGRRITVKQAIVSAGGFGPLAWPSRAEVVRRVGKDEEQIIQLDLDAIFAGTAPDFYVKPNDIVNVGTNAATVFMAVLRNAFRFSYGLGFVYDRNFADSDTFEAKQALKAERRAERQARGLPAY